jgi:hypothetical protein
MGSPETSVFNHLTTRNNPEDVRIKRQVSQDRVHTPYPQPDESYPHSQPPLLHTTTSPTHAAYLFRTLHQPKSSAYV